MNKVYKVIWNASIGAWVATSEIAKSKTKTKSKTLNLSAAVLSGVICFAPNAFAGTNTEGGIGQGTSISGTTSCREGSANTANQKDIAIGCGAQTQDRTGSNIANRNNPYNNSTGAYAGAMKQGGAISVGTGAVVEKGLGTAIGSYATTHIKNIQNNIDNISNGKAGLVQQQKPNGEITVGKDTGGTSINMAGKEGDRVVQGVKDGEIKAGSNQAVNGGQIHKISESIKNSIGGNTTIDPKDGSITTNNIGGTGKNNINDAIGTLNQSNQELGNKITNLGDQLQQVFYDTNKRIDDVEKKANAGIAAAMALENAPFVAGKYTYAVGAAYHGGENAVGVTLRKTSDNGRWSITGGVAAASQGEPSVRVGISGVIN